MGMRMRGMGIITEGRFWRWALAVCWGSTLTVR